MVRRHWKGLGAPALLLLFLTPGPSWGQGRPVPGLDPGTLTLEEVVSRALERNQGLAAAGLRVEAARARESWAGLLPDPMVQVGVMNLALPELSANMPASMAPSLQATQAIPLPSKLSLREELARRSTAVGRAGVESARWRLRAEVTAAFYRIYLVDRQQEVMEETLGLLGDFETVARSLYAAGTGRQADLLRANVEVARMEAEIQRMVAMRRGEAAHLNALLNQPADTPLPTPEPGSLPGTLPSREALLDWAEQDSPVLDEVRGEVAREGTRLELTRRDIWPDLMVGLQYGLGRMGGDLKNMGGAMVGFSIPLHASRKQDKAVEEAEAMVGAAQARLEDSRAMVDASLGGILAELDRARTLMELYQGEILPQARGGVDASLASYRAGTVDFPTLVDAQMALNRFRVEYYALIAAYGTGLAQLEMTIGRDLPVTDELILENR